MQVHNDPRKQNKFLASFASGEKFLLAGVSWSQTIKHPPKNFLEKSLFWPTQALISLGTDFSKLSMNLWSSERRASPDFVLCDTAEHKAMLQGILAFVWMFVWCHTCGMGFTLNEELCNFLWRHQRGNIFCPWGWGLNLWGACCHQLGDCIHVAFRHCFLFKFIHRCCNCFVFLTFARQLVYRCQETSWEKMSWDTSFWICLVWKITQMSVRENQINFHRNFLRTVHNENTAWKKNGPLKEKDFPRTFPTFCSLDCWQIITCYVCCLEKETQFQSYGQSTHSKIFFLVWKIESH